MSSFIHREIAKTTVNQEDIYVCMYVYGEVIVNLLFFKKTENGFEEILRYHVSEQVAKELVRKVRTNEVEKVTTTEAKIFNQSLDKHTFCIAKEIKETINKIVQDMKVDDVGDVAGIQYIVSQSKNAKMKQLFLLQKNMAGNEFGIAILPASFVEMVLLDYIHHNKVDTTTSYFMTDETHYVGIKKSKENPRILYVVKIDVFPDSVSASQAYMISKKNHYEYCLLPIEESTPQLMEGLQKEAKHIVNQFVKQMNMVEKTK